MLSLAAMGLSLVALVMPAQSKSLLTTVAEVHDLPQAAAVNIPVHLKATVTYYDPADGLLFLQDRTGGVYVDNNRTYAIHQGDLVEVDGHTTPSFRTQIAADAAIRTIGNGETLPAPEEQYGALVSGAFDARLVTVYGRVLAASIERHQDINAQRLHLDVAMDGGEIQVFSQDISVDTTSLLDSTIAVTGVAGGLFDAKDQIIGVLLHAAHGGIKVVKKPSVDALNLPLTDIDQVYQSRRVQGGSPRVRVRGTLIAYHPMEFVILQQEDNKTLYAQTRDTDPLQLGDIIDAMGFASDHEYQPSLVKTVVVKVGTGTEPKTVPVNYAQAISGQFADRLVSMQGTLISNMSDDNATTLSLSVDGHVVRAVYSGHDLPQLAVGSIVRIAGVCRITAAGPWRTSSYFHLRMRVPEDAVLIRPASWFTIRHLSILLAGLLALVTGIAAWALVLRKRVIKQTALVQRSMMLAHHRSIVLEKISSNRPLEEMLRAVGEMATKLIPGARTAFCFYGEQVNQPGHQDDWHPVPGTRILHTVRLANAEGDTAGWFNIFGPDAMRDDVSLREIYEISTELSLLAMQQSIRYNSLVHYSTHDPLTNLPNRRLCDIKLHEAIESASHHNLPVSVFYVDIDGFKEVNDNLGHRAGDLFLQEITARLKTLMGVHDTLGRIGGDEFLLIAPGVSRSQAEEMKVRISACFRNPFWLEAGSVFGSASAGFAVWPEDGGSADDLKRAADLRMYRAKRARAAVDEELARG